MPATSFAEALNRYLEADRATTKHTAVVLLERKLHAALRAHWRRQKRAVLARLATHRSLFAEAAMRKEDLPDDLAKRVEPTGELVIVIDVTTAGAFDAGAAHTLAEFNIAGAFDIHLPDAVDYLAQHGAQQVAAIDDVTRARLRRLLVDAVEHNWSYAKTARQITAMFDGFGGLSPLGHIRTRAELVSVTEIGQAYEHGGRVMADRIAATGMRLQKHWITAASDVCPICTDAAAQGWIADSDPFTNGFDGPLGHPGCRCALGRRTTPKARRTT
jgi:hypothetical protein